MIEESQHHAHRSTEPVAQINRDADSDTSTGRFRFWATIIAPPAVFMLLVAGALAFSAKEETNNTNPAAVDTTELRGLGYRTFETDVLPVEQALYAKIWETDRIAADSEFRPLADALLKRGHLYTDPLQLQNQEALFDSLLNQIDHYPHLVYAILPNLPKSSWYSVSSKLLEIEELTQDPIINFHLWAIRSEATQVGGDYQHTLNSFRNLLNATAGLSQIDPLVVMNVLTHGHAFDFRHQKRDDYIKMLSDHPDVPEWISQLEIGTQHLNQALIFQKDPLKQKDNFKKELALARTHLSRSWSLEPRVPYAATYMISISTRERKPIKERTLWFERAIEAQSDFLEAWIRYKDALLPFYGGYPEALAAYNQICFEKASQLPLLNPLYKEVQIQRARLHAPSVRSYWSNLTHTGN